MAAWILFPKNSLMEKEKIAELFGTIHSLQSFGIEVGELIDEKDKKKQHTNTNADKHMFQVNYNTILHETDRGRRTGR